MPTELERLPVRAEPAPRVKGCSAPLAPALAEPVAEALAAGLRALADPTRVQMVHMLKAADEPVCVCDFTAAFDLGQPTVSHHLAKLRDAGLVTVDKHGIWAFYRLRDDLPDALAGLVALIP
jgi:ArsR family transcriptional regulator